MFWPQGDGERARAAARRNEASDARGFVLVGVLLGVALVAALAAMHAHYVSSSLTTAATLSQSGQAEALATAGVRLAALDLAESKAGRPGRVSPGWLPFRCRLPGHEPGLLRIVVEDEGGKVDLNTASDRLLETMLAGFGADPAEASQLVGSIAEYRTGGAQASAGLDPLTVVGQKDSKQAGFDTVEELEQVAGMPGWLFARVRNYVTVHNRRSGIDPLVVASALARSLAGMQFAGSQADEWERPVPGAGPSSAVIPAAFVAPSEHRFFRVIATATLASGASFSRDVVVDLMTRPGEAPRFVRWMQLPTRQTGTSAVFDSISDC